MLTKQSEIRSRGLVDLGECFLEDTKDKVQNKHLIWKCNTKQKKKDLLTNLQSFFFLFMIKSRINGAPMRQDETFTNLKSLLCLDIAQSRINRAPNESETHS